MARIILALCLLISSVVSAQPGYTNINSRYKWIAGGFDSSLILPRYNGVPSGLRSAWNTDGQLAVDTANNHLYVYSGGAWIRIANYSDVGSSYTFPYSVVAPGNAIQLENDTTANPANYFYGRNSAGRRGWYPQSGIVGVNIFNSDGTLTGDRAVNGNYNGFEMSNISSLNIGIDDNAGMTGGINIGGDNADNDYHIRTIGSVGESGIYGYRSENKLYSVTAGSDSSFVQTDGENGISIKAFDGSLKIPLLNYTLSTTGKKIMLRDTATGLVENIDPALIGGGGSGTVTSVATNNGTGITGGTITGSGTLAIDTLNIATRLQVQHRIDSLAALEQRKINYLDSSYKLTNDSLLWRDYVNVKTFGATGDGTTNDRAAFVAAVATGRNVFVPPGTYKISAYFLLQANQTMFGLGNTSILYTTANDAIVQLNTRSRVTGLKFLGSGKSAGLTFQGGVLLYQYVGWSVDNCFFEAFSGTAQQNGGGGIYGGSVAVSNSDGGRISNCYFYNNNGGLNLMQRAEYVTITGCSFGSNTIAVGLGVGNITLNNNVIHNNTTGIKSFSGTNDAHSSISNNLINHNTYPLDIQSVSYALGNSYSNNMIYYGSIKITNSNNIRFEGGTWGLLDSIHINNSRFLQRVNVYVGTTPLNNAIPVYKYNNSDDFQLIGEFGKDSATRTHFMKMIREDTVLLKLPTALGVYNVRIDANGNLSKADTASGSGSRVSTQYDNSTTTLGNVTGLTANVAAGKTYRFEAKLYTTSNVAGGIKTAIAGTATATNIIYEGLTTDAGLITQSRATALATSVGAVTAVTAAYVLVTGTITVNAAGTITVQAAANAATGTTSVLVGSTFVLTEML